LKHCNYCNTLQQTATHYITPLMESSTRIAIFAKDSTTQCRKFSNTATQCSTLQHTKWRSLKRIATLARCPATHCNKLHTLQHTVTHCSTPLTEFVKTLQHTAAHCNTLQHTAYGGCRNEIAIFTRNSATHCNTLQTLQHTATYCSTPLMKVVETLQHIATHCNTLQHTAYGGRRNE